MRVYFYVVTSFQYIVDMQVLCSDDTLASVINHVPNVALSSSTSRVFSAIVEFDWALDKKSLKCAKEVYICKVETTMQEKEYLEVILFVGFALATWFICSPHINHIKVFKSSYASNRR